MNSVLHDRVESGQRIHAGFAQALVAAYGARLTRGLAIFAHDRCFDAKHFPVKAAFFPGDFSAQL